jgi:hypothetical protein
MDSVASPVTVMVRIISWAIAGGRMAKLKAPTTRGTQTNQVLRGCMDKERIRFISIILNNPQD